LEKRSYSRNFNRGHPLYTEAGEKERRDTTTELKNSIIYRGEGGRSSKPLLLHHLKRKEGRVRQPEVSGVESAQGKEKRASRQESDEHRRRKSPSARGKKGGTPDPALGAERGQIEGRKIVKKGGHAERLLIGLSRRLKDRLCRFRETRERRASFRGAPFGSEWSMNIREKSPTPAGEVEKNGELRTGGDGA